MLLSAAGSPLRRGPTGRFFSPFPVFVIAAISDCWEHQMDVAAAAQPSTASCPMHRKRSGVEVHLVYSHCWSPPWRVCHVERSLALNNVNIQAVRHLLLPVKGSEE